MHPGDRVNALLYAKTPAELAKAWEDVTSNWAGLENPERLKTDAIRIMQSKYTNLVLENNAPGDTGCAELMLAYKTFKHAQCGKYKAPPEESEVIKAIVAVATGKGNDDDKDLIEKNEVIKAIVAMA